VEEYELRGRILDFARKELAESNGGQPSAAQLDRYAMAAVGKPYAQSGTIQGNWCGAFAVYCMRMAGLQSCHWGINAQTNKFGICGPVQVIWGDRGMMRTGDAAILYGDYSHHVLVEEAVEEYDYLSLVEGNGGAWGGMLNARSTALSNAYCYYRVLCDQAWY